MSRGKHPNPGTRVPGAPGPVRGRLLGEAAHRAQRKAEAMAGMRCGGCRRRIGVGLHFTVFRSVVQQGRPTMVVDRLAACSREDCDYVDVARAEAAAVEQVEYAWFDRYGPDDAPGAPAPPADPDPGGAAEGNGKG